MGSTALKSEKVSFSIPPVWIFTPTLSNFEAIWGGGYSSGSITISAIQRYFLNSVVVTSLSTILCIAFALPAAYSLTRFSLKGKSKNIAFWILSMRMFVPVVAVVPYFVLMKTLGLLNTYPALILAYTSFNLPFAIWILRGFFKGIPKVLDESASIDGCSRFGIFIRIILPLIKSGLAATAVLVAIFSWNEFLFAAMLTQTEASKTLPLQITQLTSTAIRGPVWGPMAAIASTTIIPIIVLTFVVQKYILSGLTLGAVKE
jgi:multiple sugar transport system permease protein